MLAGVSCVSQGEDFDPVSGARPVAADVDLGIYMLDVGNGDATLVLGPPNQRGRRRSLLIDAGKLRPDGGRIVGALLEELDVGALDYVVATHFDADHVGGFVRVLGGHSVLWADDCEPGPHFPTEAIVDLGPSDRDTQTYAEYTRCVSATTGERGAPEHWIVADGAGLGRTMDLGGGYVATVVAGDGYVIDRVDRVRFVNSANERSIAIWVSGPQGFDFLVTGDLIGRRFGSENALVEPVLGEALAARGVDLEVLRIGHNGADNTSAFEFIDAVRPEVGLLSVSAQNDYGHPGCATVETLAQLERVVQTQAGNSTCGPMPNALVADGHVGVFVRGRRYALNSVGLRSPATGRTTERFRLECTLEGDCEAGGAVERATPQIGEIIFTEVMADPAARSDSTGEWLELFSVASRDLVLEGCWLRDDGRDRYPLRGAKLRPGEAWTLARSVAPGFTPDEVYGSALALANREDELILECEGRVIDRISWSDAPRGASFSLSGDSYSATANDRSSAWCEAVLTFAGDRGTPGEVNPSCR